MTPHGKDLIVFMKENCARILLPVYQRNYNWNQDNCMRLYNDLKKVVNSGMRKHFFGCIVARHEHESSDGTLETSITDGQQRIATVSLLLLALLRLADENRIRLNDEIKSQIRQVLFLQPDETKLFFLGDTDRNAYTKLLEGDNYDVASLLTKNYLYFYREIRKQDISPEQLYEAVLKLEIVHIQLGEEDCPQLIFDSLNSTGVPLKEGDRIRNYIHMGLPPREQKKCYNDYWKKIEACVSDDENDVSGFFRDFLSVKRRIASKVDSVYNDFMGYAEKEYGGDERTELMKELVRYAKIYEQLKKSKSEIDPDLNACLYRLNRLDIAVTRPFFMKVFCLYKNGSIPAEDVRRIFLTVETYLFRRIVCSVPANALNKIFLHLNNDVLRYDNTCNQYADKLNCFLLSRSGNGRFPDDTEFSSALETRNIFKMPRNFKVYMFERFENFGTIETKEVYANVDQKKYTIEHIMPQSLTPSWLDSLGENALDIYRKWLHRLANLTLTAYNPQLSNKPFTEKRDSPDGGYKNSGLRMNQRISRKENWGEPELEERSREMVEQALKIWQYPENSYIPPGRIMDSVSLADENAGLAGRRILKYRFQGREIPVSSWAEMFEQVVKHLHQKDRMVLVRLSRSGGCPRDDGASGENSPFWISARETDLRRALKIDENLFVETNTNTNRKLSILRRIFTSFGLDAADLVFCLKADETQ